jgi:hypothetical protein
MPLKLDEIEYDFNALPSESRKTRMKARNFPSGLFSGIDAICFLIICFRIDPGFLTRSFEGRSKTTSSKCINSYPY